MNNPDDAVERMLEGLRTVETPAGLEARVLRKLDQRVEPRPARLWTLPAPRVWRVAAAGSALLVALTVTWTRHREHSKPHDGMATTRESATLGPREHGPTSVTLHRESPETVLQDNGDHPVAPWDPPAALHPVTPRTPNQRRLQHPAQLAAALPSSPGQAPKPTAEERATLRETRAASHPAPELPLTEQERLLLRLAHRNDRNDPEVLAVLSPALRARESQEERAEFEVFFASPVTQDEQQQPITDERGNTR